MLKVFADHGTPLLGAKDTVKQRTYERIRHGLALLFSRPCGTCFTGSADPIPSDESLGYFRLGFVGDNEHQSAGECVRLSNAARPLHNSKLSNFVSPAVVAPRRTSLRGGLIVLLLSQCIALVPACADDVPTPRYHLTARPWRPLETPRNAYLDAIEGLCRFAAKQQDDSGAIIDPFLHREHQYSTPYFAAAVGVLLHAGRGDELRDHGVRAMEHATACFAGGWQKIPDAHGEFFIAPLTTALPLYRPSVDAETYNRWRGRLSVPLERVMRDRHGRINNWRTYAKKGEWLRYREGLVGREGAVNLFEDAWLNRTQRERIVDDKWNMYQDWSSDPQSHAVEAVGRGNLLGLLAAGYDGPFHKELRDAVERGTEISLLFQDPTGQCPPNGRTDDHVFNDVLYQLAFEVMAERKWNRGEKRLAGQYRRAALLSFASIERWRRDDGDWSGSYFVTKNHFDPADRVGYQPASQYMNYNGALMYHLAEAYEARETAIPQVPAPTEVGGYALAADARFGSFVANAGGMQMLANLRGDVVAKYGTYWTPLGVVRFSRIGWDSRLGPSDGCRDSETGRAVSFAPTWKELNGWVSLAEKPEHYRGTVRVDFVHPLLVRCRILYHTVTGTGGPGFYHDFILTPDAILSTLRCTEPRTFGLTLPVLVNDGQPTQVEYQPPIVSVAGENRGDSQSFICLNENGTFGNGEPLQSSYGWLRPVRLTTGGEAIRVFVYPHTADDPAAGEVGGSLQITDSGFKSVLGRVEATLYVGRTSAGGFGDKLDLDGDTTPDVEFPESCGFVLQLKEGRIVAAEADRATIVTIRGQEVELQEFTPHSFDEPL